MCMRPCGPQPLTTTPPPPTNESQSGEPVGVVVAALLGYLAMPRVGWRWLMIGLSVTGG